MTFQQALGDTDRVFLLDGGTGTLLQAAGLAPGEGPEEWNITHPDEIVGVHRAYYEAGSDIVATNTFGVNRLRVGERVEVLVRAAVENAKTARRSAGRESDGYVALDLGPTGKLLAPYGDLGFETAVSLYREVAAYGIATGVDLVYIETMSDCQETRAAVLGAREACDAADVTLPILVSNAFGADGKLMTGASPEVMVAVLEGMGAAVVGANCSLGPDALSPIVRRYLAAASVPVLCKPNAGLPTVRDGKTVFDVSPEAFAETLAPLVREGVRFVGGCCGTTPDYIRALKRAIAGILPAPLVKKTETVVSSDTRTVTLGHAPVIIGERINPTGKKRFKQALTEHDMGYILSEALREEEKGAHVLDVNVGLPGIDETALLPEVVREVQAVSPLPLALDSPNVQALEAAMRVYRGKPLVNSVNGKRESMAAVFPLLKKYGGVCVALTLDEGGIPETAGGRVAVARKILSVAAEYGIGKENLIFDPLTMAVSACPGAADVTLEAVARITRELGCCTVLGVSNISFGLPARPRVNAVFYAEALRAGLSAAILNPDSDEMQSVYHSFRALFGYDADCADYIAYAAATETAVPTAPAGELTLCEAVEKGLRDRAGEIAAALPAGTDVMAVITGELMPALDEVGKGFESGKVFLPGLLMSAEAAKAAFDALRTKMPAKQSADRIPVVLATVRGDIHDIGKNIVKLLLETYGFSVSDLGRDVPPEAVVAEVKRVNAPVVGLSALMTTTVPAMEETVKRIHAECPGVRAVVGGAVLTADYARAIGADAYARDAMETVRYAEQIDREVRAM